MLIISVKAFIPSGVENSAKTSCPKQTGKSLLTLNNLVTASYKADILLRPPFFLTCQLHHVHQSLRFTSLYSKMELGSCPTCMTWGCMSSPGSGSVMAEDMPQAPA